MGDPRIVMAARRGDVQEVRRLVQQDRGLLDTDWCHGTALTEAALYGQFGVVRCLLGEGAQVNLRAPYGLTALDQACLQGNDAMVSLLLAHGADAVSARGDGCTPLSFAAMGGHARVVALLLAHGCGDIDREDPHIAWTHLHSAAYRDKACVVRVMLGAGADAHLRTGAGETPLAVAVRAGNPECVAVLQEWECLYLLTKARRLRDAAATLHAKHAVSSSAINTTASNSQAPAYVASRAQQEGAVLPEVEVEGGAQGQSGGATGDDEGLLLLVREAVVRHVVEGLRAELFRELVGMMDG